MYLCHTGISRSSTRLLKKVNISKAKKLLPLVKQTERALQKEDPAELLELISEGWIKKIESCPDVISHPDVKSLNLLLHKEPSILSHRLCGAGNGGFFLIFAKPNWKPLINNLENKCVKINISNKGAQVKKL
jgi:galactokinase/mevalonate kinase-like predicted kinase